MSDIALKAQEEMLFSDVSDEVLEVVAGAAKVHASFTLGSCTACLSVPAEQLLEKITIEAVSASLVST